MDKTLFFSRFFRKEYLVWQELQIASVYVKLILKKFLCKQTKKPKPKIDQPTKGTSKNIIESFHSLDQQLAIRTKTKVVTCKWKTYSLKKIFYIFYVCCSFCVYFTKQPLDWPIAHLKKKQNNRVGSYKVIRCIFS